MTVTNRNRIIRREWCDRTALAVAPDLLGCTLVRQKLTGETIRGLIVETEAYLPDDPACHAYRGQTASNAHMFGPAGLSYVYFIYGMYHCLNVVTEKTGIGSAVLIRALQLKAVPAGLEADDLNRIAAGPGKLCRTLEIDRRLSGLPFSPQTGLWLEHRHPAFSKALTSGIHKISQTTRIGISKATDQPWRWYLTNNPAVSKP
ncbi:MAG: DNA-3-methyladenine glycosylase [Leptolyngbya sp. SIO4C1]|nr:DNA-3-methyladenine glycosylase [Leptolyngbya sp. SIO4C1]